MEVARLTAGKAQSGIRKERVPLLVMAAKRGDVYLFQCFIDGINHAVLMIHTTAVDFFFEILQALGLPIPTLGFSISSLTRSKHFK